MASTLAVLRNTVASLGSAIERRGRDLPIGESGLPIWRVGRGSAGVGGYQRSSIFVRAIVDQLEGRTARYECDADPRNSPLTLSLIRKIIRGSNEAPYCVQSQNSLGGWDYDTIADTPQRKNSTTLAWENSRPPSILDLLQNPNPWETGAQFRGHIIDDRFRYGDAYNYIVSSSDGDTKYPLKLLYLPSIEVMPRRARDSYKLVDWYEWRPRGTNYVFVIEPEDMIHFRSELRNPVDDCRSMSPLMNLNPQATLLRENPIYASKMVSNGGRPGMIVIPDVEDMEVHEADARKIESEIMARYSRQNMNRPMVMTEKYKVEFPDFPPSDVFSETSLNFATADICMALSVPPQVAFTVLGVKEGTQAGLKEATEAFWEDCILPLNTEISATYTKFLLPYYQRPSRRKRLFTDIRVVRALAEDLVQRDERAINKWRWNGTNLDQFLVEVNLPPIGGALGQCRYSEFVAAQARVSMEPGGGTPQLPSGGGTSGDAESNANDGQNPASGSRSLDAVVMAQMQQLIALNPTVVGLAMNGHYK